ncbi:MAG: glucose-1-phosphate adenylyltransferase subunit GlgD [Clostridia bacterium]|nr:glucose-1-phosphate adenylyltransferase subunit GlgD [Clostridia bacterium]
MTVSNRMTGIIFSNMYDECFGELTKIRTAASLPFGGRYRQIDFILSNFTNAGISRVGIVTKYNYSSLMDHIGNSQEWDLNNKDGGLVFLPPFGSGKSDVYRGKLEALSNALNFLARCPEDYVVLSDANILCNIDLREVLANHIHSACDVTVVTMRAKESDGSIQSLVLDTTDGRVDTILTNYPAVAGQSVGLGIYILSRQFLLGIVRRYVAAGRTHFEADFLQRGFNNGSLTVNLWEHEGEVLFNLDIPSFFRNNLRLCDAALRKDLFNENRPIYTKVRDEVPSLYNEGCEISNCTVADGCLLSGSATDSVLFRGVTIGRGAKVTSSILMQDCIIEDGAVVENCILDKNVRITAGTQLRGSRNNPMIVKKGETI